MKPILFLSMCLFALADWIVRAVLSGMSISLNSRARWTQRWAIRLLRVADAHVFMKGAPPTTGMIVSNHLSYLDILVIASATPAIFVSKHEVRTWPLFGWLTRCAGTIYVRRDQRADVDRVGTEIASATNKGACVVIFPEGTSSGGATVLPFKTSLFNTAAKERLQVTPLAISYEVDPGSVEDEVCYWREMVFFPHFLNLMKKRRIDCHLAFGESSISGENRKELAARAHTEVVALKAKLP